MTEYKISQLESHHLTDLRALWRLEDWNSTELYTLMLYQLQPEGFFAAVSPNGELLCK